LTDFSEVNYHRWVRQSGTVIQKVEGMTQSNELLYRLRSIKHHGCDFIITLNESWFHSSPDHGYLWLSPEEQPPKDEDRQFKTQK
jgi:hypothetical protein